MSLSYIFDHLNASFIHPFPCPLSIIPLQPPHSPPALLPLASAAHRIMRLLSCLLVCLSLSHTHGEIPYNILNISNFGASTSLPDNTAAVQKTVDTAPKGATILIPKGIWIVDNVKVPKNLTFRGAKGAILLHRPAASGPLLEFTAPTSGRISGLTFDGNKHHQSISNWHPTLLLISNGATVERCTFTNFVHAGVQVTKTPGQVTIRKCAFRNGAEHSGTLGKDSKGFSFGTESLSNARPRVLLEECQFIQDADPSINGRAPGGIIITGSDTRSAYPSVILRDLYFQKVGQEWPATGDPNRICAIELYEDCIDVRIEKIRIRDCFVGGMDLQNCSNVAVDDVIIESIRGGRDGLSTTAGIEYDPGVRKQSDNKHGGFSLRNFRIKNIPTSQGYGVWIHGEHSEARDIRISNGYTSHTREGIRIEGASGMVQPLVIENVKCFGTAAAGNGKGCDIRNFRGTAYISDVHFEGDTGPGLIATRQVSQAFFQIRNSRFRTRTGSDALTIRYAQGASLENCEFDNAGGGHGVDFGKSVNHDHVRSLQFGRSNKFTRRTKARLFEN